MRNLLATFVRDNQLLSARVRSRLSYIAERPGEDYSDIVADLMNARPGQIVLDVGGGRSCPFASRRLEGSGTRIIAVDIDAEELKLNQDVDKTRVADASVWLPFADSSVDMIVSRTTLEHLPDVPRFIAESARVLRPGGWCVHVFPGRYSPYALINRLLPPSLSRRLIHFLVPGSEGILGFRAYYSKCWPGEVQRLLDRSGFDVMSIEVAYEQAFYFDFFFPLYVINVAYDLLLRRLDFKNLAALVLVTGRKRLAASGDAIRPPNRATIEDNI